ncbi:hypothetical protein PAXINDRAFT_88006 [Paxillus involutus ATCC 200175]|uniref:Uncharacterized protein n=1 Tax=Paxillus involutus ATCC 200175 TaxID=664439 RepID=A0A0C9TDJ7_PAXIN|nr:hypothetical protein PAXINDRAFT_88006 [Paxillus involutus ATCC 200175]
MDDNCCNLDNPFRPYPNQNALLLGDWHWNQGTQKSKGGFKKLLNIIGNPCFRPEEVRDVKWDVIDQELGDNGNGTSEHEAEWVDEASGWTRSVVTISVPFHSRCQSPGPKDYSISNFYHRPLVSIIREKILDPMHHRLFHFEPYELCWHPPHRAVDIGVHGELFTSKAFLEAHQRLQESSPEPGCALPR